MAEIETPQTQDQPVAPMTPIEPKEETQAQVPFSSPLDLPKESRYPAMSFEEYETIDKAVKAEKVGAVKSAMFVAKKKNPDEHAENMGLARKYNLPVEFVESSKPQIIEFEGKNPGEYETIARKNPKLAEWLSNPNNAALAHDDIEALKKIEDAEKNHGFFIDSMNLLNAGIMDLGKRVAETPALLYDIAAVPQNLVNKALGRPQVGSPDWLRNNPAADAFKNASDYYANDIKISDDILEDFANGNITEGTRNLWMGFMRNFPTQAAIIGSYMAGVPAAGLVGAGVTTAAEANIEARKRGATPLQAAENAAVHGSVEALFESLGTFGVLKVWEKEIAKQFGKATSKEVALQFGKMMTYSMAAEGNEEFWTSAAQDFSSWMTGVDPDALKGIEKRALNAGIAGAFSGGLLTGPAGLANARSSVRAKREADTMRDTYLAIGGAIDETKTKQRLPEAAQEYVAAVTKDGPIENIYIDPDVVEQYFQTKGLNPTEEIAKLGLTKEFDHAKETSTDMKVKTADWATKLEREHYNAFADDVKFGVDKLSANEYNQLKSEAEKILEESKKELAEEQPQKNIESQQTKEIQERVKQSLLAKGYNEKEAEANAIITAAMVRRLAQGTSQLPSQVKSELGLEFQIGEGQGTPQTPPTTSVASPLGEQVAPEQTPPPIEQTEPSPQFKPKFDESGARVYDEQVVANLESSIAQGELIKSGAKIDEQGNKVGDYAGASTFPKYFQNKGYKKKDVLAIIKKFKEGKKLTDKQRAIFDDLYDGAYDSLERFELFQKKELATTTPRNLSPLGFYSQLEDEIAKMDFGKSGLATAKDILNRILNLPGIKKEEIELSGISDFLNNIAEDKEPVFSVYSDGNKMEAYGSEAEANQMLEVYWKESPAHKDTKLEVRKEIPDGKVSKDALLVFVKENTIVLDQMVLGEDYESDETDDSDLPGPSDLRWSQPSRDDDYNERSDNIDSELEHYGSDDYWTDEMKAEVRANLEKENEYDSKEELDAAVEDEIERQSLQLAEEAVDSDDYHGATFVVREEKTGWEVRGNDERGWYVGEIDKHFEKDLEEVKVQLVKYMIDEGVVSGDIYDLVDEKEIKFSDPQDIREPTVNGFTQEEFIDDAIQKNKEAWKAEAIKEDPTLAEGDDLGRYQTRLDRVLRQRAVDEFEKQWDEQRGNEIAAIEKQNYDRFRQQQIESAGDYYKEIADHSVTLIDQEKEKALKEELANDIGYLAKEEYTKRRQDPTDPYNEIRVNLYHPLLKMHLTGNDTNGYVLHIDRQANALRKDQEIRIPATLEDAKKKVIEILKENQIIKSEQVATQETPADPSAIDQPKYRGRWLSHIMSGPYENYREFLLRLPDATWKYTHEIHWGSIKNILVHFRTSDRIGADGKKYLFLEEVQSDLNQQGREYGYKDKDFDAKKERIKEEAEKSKEESAAAGSAIVKAIEENKDAVFDWVGLEMRRLNNEIEDAKKQVEEIQSGELAQAKKEKDNLEEKAQAVSLKLQKLFDEEHKKSGEDKLWGFVASWQLLIALEKSDFDFDSITDKKARDVAKKYAIAFKKTYDQGKAEYAIEEKRDNLNKQISKLKRDLRLVEKTYDNIFSTREWFIEGLENTDIKNFLQKTGLFQIEGIEKLYQDYLEKLSESRVKIKISDETYKAVPDAPYKNTEAWAALAIKRAIAIAVNGGYAGVSISPASVQIERWGTENISWVKTEDGWLVGAVEQEGGEANGMNIEEAARARGLLLEKKGVAVKTKTQLREVVKDVLQRDRSQRSIESLTESIWKQMQDTKSGLKQPRKEGMKFFYDNVLPKKVGSSILKKLDKDAKINEVSFSLGELTAKQTYEGPEYTAEQLKEKLNELVANGQASATIQAQIKDAIFDLENGKSFSKATDNLSPSSAKAIGGKFISEKNDIAVATIPITDKVKEIAQKGFTLFQPGEDGTPQGSTVVHPSGKIDINIFKDKNASTVFHELGHVYLLAMQRYISQGRASDQMRKDFDTLLKFAGVEDFSQMQRKHHEKIAKAFEVYLYEGRAPSRSLRKVFARIKVWMIEIYKNAEKFLGVSVNDDVRRVFDRMVAADDDIARAYGSPEFTAVIDQQTPEGLGLSDDEFNKLKSLKDAAQAEAKEKLSAKYFKDYLRDKTKAMKAEREKVKELMTAKAKDLPLYRALNILQRGVLPDGSPMVLKISKDDLIKIYGKEYVHALPKPNIYTTEKTGVHPDVAAELLGFSSGDEMIKLIATAKSQEDLVNEMVDLTMQAKFPDTPKNVDNILKALHNESRADLLHAELEYLAKKALPQLKGIMRKIASRPPKKKDVREHARRLVGSLQINELKPYLYQRAEVKFANQAAKLLSQGDIVGAFEAKRKELLNHELYRAVIDANEDVNARMRRFKHFKKSDEQLSKYRDMDLVNAAKAILAAFGIGKSDKTPYQYVEKIEKYDKDLYANIEAQIVSAIMGAKDYREISLDKFMTMSDSALALWDLSKSNREIELGEEKIEITKAAEELVGVINDRHANKQAPKPMKEAEFLDKATRGLLGFKSALRRVEAWARSMDMKNQGAFQRYIFNPISQAATRYRLSRTVVMDKLLAIMKPLEKDLNKKINIFAQELGEGGATFKYKAELLGALLHTGNESNMKKLLIGRGWGTLNADGTVDSSQWNAFIKRMQDQGILTKQDYDVVQAIWDLNEELKPDAQRAHKKLYGYYFNEITANAFQTPWGEYRGGYVPAAADPFHVTIAQSRLEADELLNNNNSFMYPSVDRGFTKDRVENYNVRLSIDLRMITSHIDKSLRFVHLQPAVRSVARLVMNKDFSNAMDQVDPTAIREMLIPWLQRAAQQKLEFATAGSGWMIPNAVARAVRQRTALNTMVLNWVNTAQQTLGFSMAATVVPPRTLLRGLFNYTFSPKKTANFVMEKSDYMKTVLDAQALEIRKSIDEIMVAPTINQKVTEWATQHGYALQQMIQNVINISSWAAAYDDGVSKGMDEKTAINHADSVIRYTQGSAAAEDVSRVETGEPVKRLFVMFYSYFNMQANLLTTEFSIAKELGLRKGMSRGAYIYLVGFLIPAFLAEVISKGLGGKIDEDDDGEYLDDIFMMFFFSHIRTFNAFIPVFGQLANSTMNFFNDQPYDDRITASPVVTQLESVGRLGMNIKSTVFDDKEFRTKSGAKDALNILGLMTGVPFGALGRPVGYQIDVEEGNTSPDGTADYIRGLMSGRNSDRPSK